ncbi:hypothetical protein KIN20_017567 [Parelaphostrongylus tenuis]|uniref:Uncharacterized protein n=1 Tax=Parelaphostrongylus tenuis TaxID=148309 RepID=A0AAD5MI41_PARTN|nr:hypothetical protein KIN20_017567 [Parelaphostrongylus tenuis]
MATFGMVASTKLKTFDHSYIWDVERLIGEDALNVLLNNAGIFIPYFTHDAIDRQKILDCLNVNTVGAAITCQADLNQLGKTMAVDLANEKMLIVQFAPGCVQSDMDNIGGLTAEINYKLLARI